MVLSGAVTFANWADKQTQQSKLKIEELENTGKRIEELRIKEKSSHEEEAQQLKNQIDKLQKDLQAKAEAKKAQERSVIAKAVAPAAQAYGGSCAEWMQAAGVSDMANASELIRRESGCNPGAVNRSSGACGIPQALPCSKLGTSDPVAQIRWMQNYVVNRYGSWANAVAWHNAKGWY